MSYRKFKSNKFVQPRTKFLSKRSKDTIYKKNIRTEADAVEWTEQELDSITSMIKKDRRFSPKSLVILLTGIEEMNEIKSLWKNEFQKEPPKFLQTKIKPLLTHFIKIYRPELKDVLIGHTDRFLRDMTDIGLGEDIALNKENRENLKEFLDLAKSLIYDRIGKRVIEKSRKEISDELKRQEISIEEDFVREGKSDVMELEKPEVMKVIEDLLIIDNIIDIEGVADEYLWSDISNPNVEKFRKEFVSYFEVSEEGEALDINNWFKIWDLMKKLEKQEEILFSDFLIFEETVRNLEHHHGVILLELMNKITEETTLTEEDINYFFNEALQNFNDAEVQKWLHEEFLPELEDLL